MNLVIVESPTKAKTISRFLGKDWQVESSYGHLRDLPKRELGVDIENNFQPKYVVARSKIKQANFLKKTAAKSEQIYFATDEDREGEAIAWHLIQIIKPLKEKIKRIAFHEITEEAITHALSNPREIDMDLIDAQQARRVLDRLVGYKLSPFLWKKVAKGLSAGRVQSVAVRLIVEREREIEKFISEKYWQIEGEFQKENKESFKAKLYKIKGKILDKLEIKNKEEAENILNDLKGADYIVGEIKKRENKKIPLPPFTTSSLQQEANRRLGYSAKKTMMLAQQLYEGINIGEEGSAGLITYMRTDSFNISDKFIKEVRSFIQSSFGQKYLSKQERKFQTRSKLAQEAHEAIRPTLAKRSPEEIKKYLNDQQYKLYSLVWKRAVACQMAEALVESTLVDVFAKNKEYVFRANGSVIKFDGFIKIYGVFSKEMILPSLENKERLQIIKLNHSEHLTQPPARYSDAGLVKALEEYGIGRPSTYAPTISTIIDRGYAEREEKRLKPKEIAFLVNDLLVEHFPQIVDFKFTALMEDGLDQVAQGRKKWTPLIKEFYYPFQENLDKKYQEISKKELTEEETNEVCEKCGKPMVIKMSRFGKFLACTGFPQCRNAKPLETEEKEEINEVCEKCGKPMVMKKGRFGSFLGCSGYPECKNIKSLKKSTNIPCPSCGKGEIVEKRSKRGRIFFACDNYPQCKFALWQKPTGEKCPQCNSLLTYIKDNQIRCSNKECGYIKES